MERLGLGGTIARGLTVRMARWKDGEEKDISCCSLAYWYLVNEHRRRVAYGAENRVIHTWVCWHARRATPHQRLHTRQGLATRSGTV